LVDSQDFTAESLVKPFIAYECDVHGYGISDPKGLIDSSLVEETQASTLDAEEFWLMIEALDGLDLAETRSRLSGDPRLQAFGSRLIAAIAELAPSALATVPQLHGIQLGSDALQFWCAAVVFRGKDVYERVSRGADIELDERSWADGELYLAIADDAVPEPIDEPNSRPEVKIDAASLDEAPIARSVVGVWFLMRHPAGQVTECVGVFLGDVFEGIADQALAAATRLAVEQHGQLLGTVEAFDSKAYDHYDGLEIFSAQRRWNGDLQSYLSSHGLRMA
jgi:hypothetical protein